VVQQVADRLPDAFRSTAVASLAEWVGEADPTELDELQALIDERRKALKGS
jgi:hypothetical protein